jgi:hypothetical protein
VIVTIGFTDRMFNGCTRCDDAVIDREKGPGCAGGDGTTSVTSTVCWFCPVAFPRTVNVKVPVAAAPPTLIVTLLDVSPWLTCCGTNPAVTPVGSPTVVNETPPANPPVRITPIEKVPVPFLDTVNGDPVTVMVKPPAGGGGGFVVPPSPPPPHPIAANALITATHTLGRTPVPATFTELAIMPPLP